MARILCSLSGVEYTCEYMKMYLTSRESHHPIFDLSSTQLLALTPRWLDGELSTTENYLLYVALFHSTSLVDFRVPTAQSHEIVPIIAQNMAPLAAMVERISRSSVARINETLQLPRFVITPDTKDLASSADWIKIWEEAFKNYEDNYKTANALEKLERKETVLERLIKDRTKDISSYASRLADWASEAAGFDTHANYIVLNELDKHELMSSYWKRIIIACAKLESVWNIPQVDLQDLIEHCEEYIYHGSIYAHTLMSLLRSGQERQRNFLDLGDIDIGSNGAASFRVLDASTSIEDANKLALIDSAPVEKPIEKNYPNKLAYIRANLNWKLKQDYELSIKVDAKMKEIADTALSLTHTPVAKKEGE